MVLIDNIKSDKGFCSVIQLKFYCYLQQWPIFFYGFTLVSFLSNEGWRLLMLCLVDGKYPHINPKPQQNTPMWIFILPWVEKAEKYDCGAVSVSVWSEN